MKLYKLLFHSLFFIQSLGTSASPEFSADNCNVYAKQGIKSKQTKKKGKKKNQVKQYQNKERGLGCYYSRNASGRRTASVCPSEAINPGE